MADETRNSGLRYKIDAGRSFFTAQAFADGMLSFMGHNPKFAVRKYGGEIQLAADNARVESMLLIAQAASLSLINKVSEKDKTEIENTMRSEVLEISRFAEIVFVSKDISMRQIEGAKYAVEINGILSLHGEKRDQKITVGAEIAGKTISAKGGFKLKQSDFKIKQTKALGGTLKVKDEVEIYFEITAEI
ncbi:MAG: YceI family protein [Pyrinomonadaceae bacterium]